MSGFYHKMQRSLLLCIVSILFSYCHESNKNSRATIVKNIVPYKVSGEVVIKGNEDLLISNDIVLLDSFLVVVNLKQISKHGSFFYVYDIGNFEKKYSFGDIGAGPNDFSFPLSIKAKNSSGSFSVVDLNLQRIVKIALSKSSVAAINSEKIDSHLSLSFNLNQTQDNVFFGVKNEKPSKGIFFKYSKLQEKIEWIDYAAANEKKIGAGNRHDLYYNALCINENAKVVIVAFRYFNKILFFDYEGKLLNDVQIGETEIFPSWDSENASISRISATYFYDMASSDNYIYCLWVENLPKEDEGYNSVISKVIVFNLNGEYVASLSLDFPVVRIKVASNDSFILAIADDGTGLANVIKYDLSKAFPL